MEIKEWNGSQNDLMRIIQESVPASRSQWLILFVVRSGDL